MRQFVTLGLTVVVACGIALTAGCENDAGNTALLGTAIGAGVGALAGGDAEGALIGGAVGGGAGYMIGNESDKEKTQSEIASVRAEQNVETVWITNSNGSQQAVRLRRDGPGYIGPRGERYPSRPTEAQLKQMYGQ